MQAIREATGDGRELVDFMLSALRGQVDGTRLRDRLEAATWLADRGFGRPAPATPPDADAPGIEALLDVLSRRGEGGRPKVYDE